MGSLHCNVHPKTLRPFQELPMSKPLVVVESPTKVKTLKKILGPDFNVAATVGHIKDLPSNEIGIDVEKGFKPKYRNIPGKQKVISSLKKEAGDTDTVYLAPDPDREGEAIAWHTAEVLKKNGRRFHRVLFHELTQNGVREAMERPLDLNEGKYAAQKARRILDRLVGYQISPLLWRKVKNGLSAGRVQSVAVRIICERERTIQAFDPEEYWSITARFTGENPPSFSAKLVRKSGKKFKMKCKADADAVLSDLENAAAAVKKVAKKTVKRNPYPPFTTSKLQQDAIRKLRFSARKTMMVAQELYEGVETPSGETVGLITYMRTDSTRIAAEAAHAAADLIRSRFGADHALDKPRFFKNRKKAQDAHEAIRPADVFLTPEVMKPFLSRDQFSLYSLIWKRFIASQMAPALIDSVSVTVLAGDYEFAASGSTVKFAGWLSLYQSVEDREKEDAEKGEGRNNLPELAEGMDLKPEAYLPKQHFTQPPPRFSEAGLVKELEENGIGRPSTYAAILSTIQEKGYVEKEKGNFRPSELGFIVNDLVVASFPDVFNVAFTARMEDRLDRIEETEAEMPAVLTEFYGPFSSELEQAGKNMRNVKGVGVPTDLKCPECGGSLHIKVGRNGHFLACSAYPDCSYSRDYVRDEKGKIQIIEPVRMESTGEICEKCGEPMVVRRGRYGMFLACSGYPACKNTKSLSVEEGGQATDVTCPEDGCGGKIVARRSRRGKEFFGCANYPDCTFAVWDRPVNRECPACGSPYMLEKTTKKEGKLHVCPDRDCRNRIPDNDSHPLSKRS